jgi:hypothetical protein
MESKSGPKTVLLLTSMMFRQFNGGTKGEMQ